MYSGDDLPPFYIGSTSIENLTRGYHGSVSSKEFRDGWKAAIKNFPECFSTVILTSHVTREEALCEEERLQRYLDVIRSPLFMNQSYARGGFVRTGPLSEETKAKIRAKLSGRKIPLEVVEKVAKSLKGKKRDPRIGEKISQSKQGIKLSAAHAAKCGDCFRGRKHSDETKQKMSEARIGRKHSEETKQKMREAHAARKQQNGASS